MSRFKRTLLLALVALATAGALSAAVWQLRRLTARKSANAAVLRGRDLPPLELTRALRDGTPPEGRTVTVRGRFLSGGEMLLRGRAQLETPGLQVVTAFQPEDGSAVLWVLRGFVASPDVFTRPPELPAPAADTVTLTGLMLPLPETDDAGAPFVTRGDTTWTRMDRTVMQRRVTGALPWYLHLTGDRGGPGRLLPVPLPAMDDGPHLYYVIQWIGIAMAIVTFGYLMIWRGRPPQKSET